MKTQAGNGNELVCSVVYALVACLACPPHVACPPHTGRANGSFVTEKMIMKGKNKEQTTSNMMQERPL